MVRRKQPLTIAETETEDERSTKSGGFFANWFSSPSRTETRDESDYSAPSGSSDSIDDQYPMSSRRGRRATAELSGSFEDTDMEFDTADEDSLMEFDRDLRSRHAQACKYMRVSPFSTCSQCYRMQPAQSSSNTLSHLRMESFRKPSRSLRESLPLS
jgi:hypothetical protein